MGTDDEGTNSSTRALYSHHSTHLPLPSRPMGMSVTQKAAANLVRHTARQQVPALRQSAAIQQTRTRADASTTTNASFKSPFHRGESSHQDTTVIPSFKKYRAGSEASNKMFSYFMVGAFGGLSALGAKDTVQNFLVNMSASADVLAQAKVEVDLGAIPEGKNVIIKWRGKPVFIRHRTADEIKEADEPEWQIMLGVCTHLGCVPIGESGDFGGWFCPCHGSHYDISGRARKGPAPLNLEVPEYDFPEDTSLVIG